MNTNSWVVGEDGNWVKCVFVELFDVVVFAMWMSWNCLPTV